MLSKPKIKNYRECKNIIVELLSSLVEIFVVYIEKVKNSALSSQCGELPKCTPNITNDNKSVSFKIMSLTKKHFSFIPSYEKLAQVFCICCLDNQPLYLILNIQSLL